MRFAKHTLHITGSARAAGDEARLQRAHLFVRAMAREVLTSGGALVVLAGREPRSDRSQLPLIFDWVILEELAAFLRQPAADASQHEPALCGIIVTAPNSEHLRISEERSRLFAELRYSERVRIDYVPDELYTGEVIRQKLRQHASAICALGGGKGVSVLATGRGDIPLLPMDALLGASCNDGDGSLALRRHAIVDPGHFFRGDVEAFKLALPRLSLEDFSQPPEDVALRAVAVLAHELQARRRTDEHTQPPSHIPEIPLMHPSVTATLLNNVRIRPWDTLSDRESLFSIDKLGGPEILEIRRRLEQYGICRIRLAGQNPEKVIIQALARHFGEVMDEQNDFQGSVKPIVPQRGLDATSGDSAGRLGPHADGTQYVRQPALLIFQYIRTADLGAESTFWDLSHILLELDPAKRDALLIALAHPEAGNFGKKGLSFRGPMATRTQQNTVMIRERFDTVIGLHDTVHEAHEYLRERLKKQGIVYSAFRGDIVIFDNGRILHGREEVGGDPAQRLHHRMWISDLRGDLQTEMLLGVRPIEPAVLARIPLR
ncbi:MAG: TauD/TfdA family dioxygenase [Polyangia bacterium]